MDSAAKQRLEAAIRAARFAGGPPISGGGPTPAITLIKDEAGNDHTAPIVIAILQDVLIEKLAASIGMAVVAALSSAAAGENAEPAGEAGNVEVIGDVPESAEHEPPTQLVDGNGRPLTGS